MINFILELQKELTKDLSKIEKSKRNRHVISLICVNSGIEDIDDY